MYRLQLHYIPLLILKIKWLFCGIWKGTYAPSTQSNASLIVPRIGF